MRSVIENIFKRVAHEVLEKDLGEPSLFVSALLGRVSLINSRAERLVVTLIGERAAEIVKPFFEFVEPVSHPFDFRGTLRRSGTEYVVKVVSGVKAFNSTTKKAVVNASYRYSRPVILTIQGSFGDVHVRELGRAKWYDGVATWSFLTGRGDAYREFVRMVYDTARPYRSKIVSKIISEVSSRG